MCTSDYVLNHKQELYINTVDNINKSISKFCGEDIAKIISKEIIDLIEYSTNIKFDNINIEKYIKLDYKLKIECNSGYKYYKLIDTNAPICYISKCGYKFNSEIIYRCAINDNTMNYKYLHTNK